VEGTAEETVIRMTNEERRNAYLKGLEEHRHLLRTAVTGMEKGDLTQALPLAVSIRVLVHETPRNKPLLKQLRPGFLDLPIVGMVLATPSMPLRIPATMTVTTEQPYLRLNTEPGGDRDKRSTLGNWWNGPFVVLPVAGTFSTQRRCCRTRG